MHEIVKQFTRYFFEWCREFSQSRLYVTEINGLGPIHRFNKELVNTDRKSICNIHRHFQTRNTASVFDMSDVTTGTADHFS